MKSFSNPGAREDVRREFLQRSEEYLKRGGAVTSVPIDQYATKIVSTAEKIGDATMRRNIKSSVDYDSRMKAARDKAHAKKKKEAVCRPS